jgi:steroid delta-isomerase-like uncharacterized protein
MSIEQNKALARRMVEEILNQGNTSLVDELFASDYVEREELPPGMPRDREALKLLAPMMHSAFPDFKATINDLIAEGDKVVLYLTWTGTQKGEWMGIPPSGKCISIGVIDIFRMARGKFAEHWGLMDSMAMMQQLGGMSAPE